MTIWRPDLEARPGPLYMAIVDALAAEEQRKKLQEPS